MDLGSLLTFAKKSGASDLHLSAGAIPMVRIHGDMRMLEVEGEDLSSKERVRKLLYDFLTDAQKKKVEADWELDCAITLGTGDRFRANFFQQERGMSAVFRVIPTEIKSADDLGLPQAVRDFAELEKGLVLVTGPTGSGKSTTLAALIDHINRTRPGHIITVEDPIEFVHKQKKCMVNQREVGSHTKAFSNALKSALREDPDVILIGEMRDLETMSLAITAAETGHLVFGTLHTSSAAKTVDRIVNVFPADEQAHIRELLAGSIQGIVAQMLLKKRGGGRIAAHEILVATDGARAMIRDGKTYQLPSVLQTGARYGMQTLEQALEKMAERGSIERAAVEETLVRAGLKLEEPAQRPTVTQDEPREPPPRSSAPAPAPPPLPTPVTSSMPDLLDQPSQHSGVPTRSFTGTSGPKPPPKPKPPAERGAPVLVLGSGGPASPNAPTTQMPRPTDASRPVVDPFRPAETSRITPDDLRAQEARAQAEASRGPRPPTPAQGQSRPGVTPPPSPAPTGAAGPNPGTTRQPRPGGEKTPTEGLRAGSIDIDSLVAKVKEQRKKDGDPGGESGGSARPK